MSYLKKMYNPLFCISLIVSLSQAYGVGLPESAVKVTADNNPSCVEYYIVDGESYCSTDKNKAISYFEEVINNYPNSEYVGKAQQWITRIR